MLYVTLRVSMRGYLRGVWTYYPCFYISLFVLKSVILGFALYVNDSDACTAGHIPGTSYVVRQPFPKIYILRDTYPKQNRKHQVQVVRV